MIDYLIAHPEVVAAALSAIATALAAYATWQGPRSAAQLAEQLRRSGDAANEKRRLKLRVFATIMQERVTIWSPEAVRVLNLIDVVFNDVRAVREAWADLYAAFDQNQKVPEHAKAERLRKLLLAMADDLGLSDGLRLDDLTRVYYPEALAQRVHLESLQREEALRLLTGRLSPTANTAGPQVAQGMFPPRPE